MVTSVYKSRLPLSAYCSVPQVNALGSFNGQLNTTNNYLGRKSQSRKYLESSLPVSMSVFRGGILIVN